MPKVAEALGTLHLKPETPQGLGFGFRDSGLGYGSSPTERKRYYNADYRSIV